MISNCTGVTNSTSTDASSSSENSTSASYTYTATAVSSTDTSTDSNSTYSATNSSPTDIATAPSSTDASMTTNASASTSDSSAAPTDSRSSAPTGPDFSSGDDGDGDDDNLDDDDGSSGIPDPSTGQFTANTTDPSGRRKPSRTKPLRSPVPRRLHRTVLSHHRRLAQTDLPAAAQNWQDLCTSSSSHYLPQQAWTN